MPVTITATLLTASDPKPVQVVLNGITAALGYVVTATASGATWDVPGGTGTSTGAQVVLTDNRAPLNTPLVYEVVVSGVTYTSSSVTVTYTDADVILQSVDGSVVVPVDLVSAQDPRSGVSRVALYSVSGRRNPATRYDLAGSNTTTWEVEAEGDDATTLEALLATGAPLVRRTILGLRDLSPVLIVQPTGWSSYLVGAVGTLRSWALSVREVDDPQPSTAVSAFDWDYWDTKFAASTWTAFDALFASSTWDQWDSYDWSQL